MTTPTIDDDQRQRIDAFTLLCYSDPGAFRREWPGLSAEDQAAYRALHQAGTESVAARRAAEEQKATARRHAEEQALAARDAVEGSDPVRAGLNHIMQALMQMQGLRRDADESIQGLRRCLKLMGE